jgi:hypothetical protein
VKASIIGMEEEQSYGFCLPSHVGVEEENKLYQYSAKLARLAVGG